MQPGTAQAENGNQTDSTYLATLECLFRLPKKQLLTWHPGSRSFCRHLETCFSPLLSAEYAPIWRTLGKETPDSPRGCWQLFRDVHVAISACSEKSSIEDVWKMVCTLNGPPASTLPLDAVPVKDHAPLFILVFSVICWSTMTLQPKLNWPEFCGEPSLMVHRQVLDQDTLRIESSVQRPIPALFGQFHRAMSTSRWRHPIGEATGDTSEALEVACLNYASLRDIAKINLDWVTDLTSHLDFDATNRRLSVYKFPTFCALSAVAAGGKWPAPILEGVEREVYGSNKMHDNHSSLHAEVLLSYRLIFGQRRGSRQLAKAALRLERKRVADEYDELLDPLCAHPYDHKLRDLPSDLWPVTCRNFKGSLQEQSSYSSRDDFPHLGQRLAKLQNFTRRQQPSELWDLWRDRRNPLQWYTFWAVLIVGGISIVLGVLQAVVGVAQLVVAIIQLEH
ncbi:hypothetical protein F5144DRAFT_479266 [Chaetomium tenue]|uniref:Uncharacterized protein n=1 Tax=Chaetomium tenue TaxID=1854479 RepID=A0ACB7PP76_9PEZI|nr:hypothetical protein F5144DRAFT_479266 [Chaetomium globosum]